MSFLSSCVKCALNILNILNGLFGLVLIGLATVSLNNTTTSFIIYLYVIGSLVFIASLLGCCGICQEHAGMTMTYAILLLILLILRLLSIFGLDFDSDAIKKFSADSIEEKWNEELVHPGAMNATQIIFHCCGRYGPDDYIKIGRLTIPPSCYPKDNTINLPHYTQGCVQAMTEKYLTFFAYSKNSEWISITISAVICIAAFYLASRFRKQRIRYHY